MFKELWMSGVILAFLSFGIKTGMGMGSRLLNSKGSGAGAMMFSMGTLFSYMVLFFALHVVVTRLNLLNYLDQLIGLIQYGMVIHLIVALGLMIWGVTLLIRPAQPIPNQPVRQQTGQQERKQNPDMENTSRGAALFLVLPCPVCATVILLNLTLALSLSRLTPMVTTFALFSLFFGIVLATIFMLYLFRKKQGIDNGFLGASMVLIALYFFMTVLIAPIYPKLEPAFAMAISNNPMRDVDLLPILILIGASLVLSGIGFYTVYFNTGYNSDHVGRSGTKKYENPRSRKGGIFLLQKGAC